MVQCKYDLARVEPVDFNMDSVSMDIAIAITNVNKNAAASLKRFDGDLYVNETGVAKMTLKDVRIEAGDTKVVKSTLLVPYAALGKTLTGLVSMGSVSVDYMVKGTMYFETPIGDIPYPVTIYQSKKF